jgi:tetratricopeptide (TPR) repeat protein
MFKTGKRIIIILAFAALAVNCPGQESAKEEEALFVAKKAFEDGYYEVSLGMLQRFLNNYPGSSRECEAGLMIAQCYFYQNKFFEALGKLEALLKNSSCADIKDALNYWLGEVYFKSDNFPRASLYYLKVIQDYPNSSYSPLALYSLGFCSFRAEKFKEALDYFLALEQKHPNEPQVKDAGFKIIECLYSLKNYPGLREKAQSYIKRYPDEASRMPYLYFYLAESEYYLNNLSAAVECYAKSLKDTRDEKIKIFSGLGLGWSYLKLGKYPEAEAHLASIREEVLDNRGWEAYILGRATLLAQTGKLKEADIFYSRLIEKAKDAGIILLGYLGKGDSFYSLGEYAKAAAAYRQALAQPRQGGQSLEALDKLHYNLGLALAKQGELKDALNEFQKVAGSGDGQQIKAGALVQIADLYRDSAEYSKAVEAYNNLLAAYPESLYAGYVKYQLGSLYIKRKDFESAINILKQLRGSAARERFSENAAYALGLAYYQKGDYLLAIEAMDELRKGCKDKALAAQSAYLTASSLYNLGDYKKALDSFKEALAISQDTRLSQKIEYGLADTYYQLGNEEEALARFKALRSRYPGSPLTSQAVFWLASYYYQNDDPELAARYFLSLIQDFPESGLSAEAYYSLGLISSGKRKYQEALDNFNQAIKSGNAQIKPLALNAAAEVLSAQGDYASGVVYYRRALQMAQDKESAGLRFKMADCLEASGNPDAALAEYNRIANLPSAERDVLAKALLRSAKIYEDREDYKKALEAYNKVIEAQSGESDYARERVEWINERIR